MSPAPAVQVEAARRVPIQDVMRAHGLRLKKAGAAFAGPCPACGGRDRFAVNVIKQIFNCRGCNNSGDVIALEMFLSGAGFAAAVRALIGGGAPVQRAYGPAP
jgi:DNA primase